MIRHLIFIAIFCGCLMANAQPVPTKLSLEEAQKQAVTNSYQTRLSALDYQKARKIITETASTGLPQISASANFQRNIDIPVTPIPAQAFDPSAPADEFAFVRFGLNYNALGQFNVSQLIFDGSYIVALIATRVIKENAMLEIEATEIEVKDMVAKTYHAILVNESTRDAVVENLKFIRKNFDETQKLQEAGFLEEQDVDQLEIIVNDLENNRQFLERMIEISRMLLNVQMGAPLEHSVELTDDIESLIAITSDGESLLNKQFELDRNIDYRLLLTQEQVANLQVRNEYWQYAPRLSGFYNYAQNFFSDNASDITNNERWFPNSAIGLSLNWTLFNGMAREARIQQAKIDLDKLDIAKSQMGQNVTLQYEQTRVQYEHNLNTLQTRKRSLQLAQKIRNNTEIKFREGMVSSLDFSQAQSQYQNALRDYFQAAQQVLDSRSELEKVMGNYNR